MFDCHSCAHVTFMRIQLFSMRIYAISVGSAPAWQTGSRRFEPGLEPGIVAAENIPVLSGRLVYVTKVLVVF